jgi:hypothetical protein
MQAFPEKITIFVLLAIAAMCTAAVVLPSLLVDSEMFSRPANAEPFLGQ